MEPIIEPIDRELLVSELTQECFLRDARFGGNKIYTVNYANAPHVLREIGRLRELAFRRAGGGTGLSFDIDEFDVHPLHASQQIVVWNPERQQILGGYRYILCSDARNLDGTYDLATAELFDYSEKFKKEYMPVTIELGRSFVYDESMVGGDAKKSVFVLDNLWEGIGAVVARNPSVQYLFGKVTMYLSYDKLARDYILFFMNKYFADAECLVSPKERLDYHHDKDELSSVFVGNSFEEDYKILSKKVRERNCTIPPLVNSYIQLSRTMKVFGTSLNKGFGAVEETGILVNVNDIDSSKRDRYVLSYQK